MHLCKHCADGHPERVGNIETALEMRGDAIELANREALVLRDQVSDLNARVAELEAAICRHVAAREGESGERPDITVAVLYRIDREIKQRTADSVLPVQPAQVDETGGFRLGQLVYSKARPGETFVVTFAGRHHEGPPILSVRAFDDPNMQFFDVQSNFTPVPARPPLIVSDPVSSDAKSAVPEWLERWRDEGAMCMRCWASLSWAGDEPENEDDAICNDCAWQELQTLRSKNAPRPNDATHTSPEKCQRWLDTFGGSANAAQHLAELLDLTAADAVKTAPRVDKVQGDYRAALEEIYKNTSCSETKRRARRALHGAPPGPPPLPWVPGVTGRPAVSEADSDYPEAVLEATHNVLDAANGEEVSPTLARQLRRLEVALVDAGLRDRDSAKAEGKP